MQPLRPALAALALAALLAPALGADAPAVQPFEPFTTVTGKDGLWIVGNTTGRLRYCVAMREATSSFVRGSCTSISGLAPSATGFEARSAGADLYVVNKSTGSIQLCSPVVDKVFVRGSCQQIATLDRLPEVKKP